MFVTKYSEITKQFPIAMRVLAVDFDHNSLLLLGNLLISCQYQVTLADNSKTALELVRDEKNKFDLIIIEKEMPEIDGFMCLQLITRQTNVPVILMSSNSNPELMEKAIRFGAYFVLAKPLTIEMIKNTCLNVLTKHKVENKNSENCSCEKRNMLSDPSILDYGLKSKRNCIDNGEKRVKMSNSTVRKRRFVWTAERRNQFIVAVNQIERTRGVDKVTPKNIHELMNVEGLTRWHVASHLQKHRINSEKNIGENQQANMDLVVTPTPSKMSYFPENGNNGGLLTHNVMYHNNHFNLGNNNNLLVGSNQLQAGPSKIGGFSHQFSSQMSVPPNEFEMPTRRDGLFSDGNLMFQENQLQNEVRNENEDFVDDMLNDSPNLDGKAV